MSYSVNSWVFRLSSQIEYCKIASITFPERGIHLCQELNAVLSKTIKRCKVTGLANSISHTCTEMTHCSPMQRSECLSRYYCHSFFDKSSWQAVKGPAYRSFLYSTGYNLLFFISRKMGETNSNWLVLAVEDLKYWCLLYLSCSACKKREHLGVSFTSLCSTALWRSLLKKKEKGSW